jgi:hypothetical protein
MIAFMRVPALESISPEAIFILLMIVSSMILLPIKRLIKTNSNNKLKLAELKKWKLDGDLFLSQWRQEQEVDTTVWQNDLLLGDSEAPLQITIACNPYCNPCAKTHKQLDNLLRHYPSKIKVQVRFLFTAQDENNKLTIAVKAILQRASIIQNNSELRQLLTDWFDWMDYDKWTDKWKSDSNIDIGKRMIQHNDWIVQSKIQFTPTIFINGKKLPGRYSLDDMEILIPQLAASLKEGA